MRRIGTLVLAATLSAGALMSGTANAGAAQGSWVIAPRINALWIDDARAADDDAGGTLGFGYTMSEKWDVEFSLYGSEHQKLDDDSLERQGYGLSLNRVFYREGRVNPFLTLGIAQTKTILKPGA